ncbi:MAG: sigma-70 family RNA polymerase sigma factor [Actinomycetota bacterium]
MPAFGAAVPDDACISAPSGDWKVDDHAPNPAAAEQTRRTRWLVERAQEGDKEAFGELYRLCHPSVSRIVRFYLPGASGEDAVQETFVRAWSALPRYRDTGAPFSAWLGGIARHVVGDALKAARRVQPSAEIPEQAFDFSERWDDRIELARVVAQLPADQRHVIELKFLLGWTNDQVAIAMGKSPGAINTLQWRALERMKRIMSS